MINMDSNYCLLFDKWFYFETIYGAFKYQYDYMPYIRFQFYVLNKDGYVKLAAINICILDNGLKDILDILIEFCDNTNSKLIGCPSSIHTLEYFTNKMEENNISYGFEKDNEGRLKIFW